LKCHEEQISALDLFLISLATTQNLLIVNLYHLKHMVFKASPRRRVGVPAEKNSGRPCRFAIPRLAAVPELRRRGTEPRAPPPVFSPPVLHRAGADLHRTERVVAGGSRAEKEAGLGVDG